MSALTESQELKARFASVWANRSPVAYPGIIFAAPSPPAEWCRFTITRTTEGEQVSFGDVKKNRRYPGVIFIQIFIPIGIGNSLALQRGEEAAAIFQGWLGTNIKCKTATVKDIGVTGDGWYQVNTSVSFVRDELT